MKGKYCECGKEAMVGVGQPPTWICLDHFNDYLKGTREMIEAAKKMPRVITDPTPEEVEVVKQRLADE